MGKASTTFNFMSVIIGIDPGSRITGYGLISSIGNKCEYVSSGCIRVGGGPFSERLKTIFEGLSEVISQFCAQEMAVEQVFMAKNAGSALKLGHARGAAIVAGVSQGLIVSEYSARQIKQSVVGTGSADKIQVQHMVKSLLGLSAAPQEDAADALAAALCHAHTQHSLIKMAGAKSIRRGRLR